MTKMLDFDGLINTIELITVYPQIDTQFVIRTPYTKQPIDNLSSSARQAFQHAFYEAAYPYHSTIEDPGAQQINPPQQTDWWYARQMARYEPLIHIVQSIAGRRR